MPRHTLSAPNRIRGRAGGRAGEHGKNMVNEYRVPRFKGHESVSPFLKS